MELNQLRYFQVVARHQHMTRAANELHISQSSLSKTIAALEADVGAPLFDRPGGRIVLNETGRRFLERINRSLMELDDAVREAGSCETGTVTFAVANAGICAEYLSRFLHMHPTVRVCQFPMPYRRIQEALEKGDVDFALSFSPLASEHISWEPLTEEEVLLLVSCRHPLAEAGEADLQAFRKERFIFSNSDFGLTEAATLFCRDAGFAPDSIFEGDQTRLSLQLTADNLGVMFMSAYEYRWLSEGPYPDPLFARMRALHIRQPACLRSIGLAQLKGHYVSPLNRPFIDGLRAFYQENHPPEGYGEIVE